MKTSNLMKLLALISALFLMVSCSKDKQLPPDNAVMAKKVIPELFPSPGTGSIKGFLTPTPQEALIQAYNNSGFIVGVKMEPNGSFIIDNLPEGTYQVYVAYLTGRADFSFWTYHEIPGVAVLPGETTSMGEIVLPWAY
jgi:uncharacterized lipoprotein YajG